MDQKITKKRVSLHLEYDWLKYLGIILAAVLVWILIYTVSDYRNKIYEEIKFLVLRSDYMTTVTMDEFRGDLSGHFEVGTEGAVIRDVYSEVIDYKSESGPELFTTRMISNFDFAVGDSLEFNSENTLKNDKGEEYKTVGKFSGAVVDLDKAAEDVFSFESFGRAAGFTDEAEFAAFFAEFKFVNNDGEFAGFKISMLSNIDRIFPGIKEHADKTLVIGFLSQGGNIGTLNGAIRGVDVTRYNEAYESLAFMVAEFR